MAAFPRSINDDGSGIGFVFLRRERKRVQALTFQDKSIPRGVEEVRLICSTWTNLPANITAAEMGPSAHGHYSGHRGTHWKHQGQFWCLPYITKETFRGLSLVCKVSTKELVNVPAPHCQEEGFLPSPPAPQPLLSVCVAFCTTPLPFLGCSSTFCCILLLGKVGEFGLCSKTFSPWRQEMNPLLAF